MEVLAAIATMIVLAIAAVVQPARAECPVGWHVANLKPSGAFSCGKAPARGTCETTAGCNEPARDPEIAGRIYCTGGRQPIQGYDGRTVGCQAVH